MNIQDLPIDILSTVLNYLSDFIPLLRHVCHRWSDMNMCAHTTPPHFSLRQLSFHGYLHIIQWVFPMRHNCAGTPQSLIGDLAKSAVDGGHISIVRYIHDKLDYVRSDCIFWWAAKAGQADIMQLCHDEWGIDRIDLKQAIYTAAFHGHENIVRLCYEEFGFSKYQNKVHKIFIYAASSGHAHIMRMCYYEWKVDDIVTLNQAMCAAAENGHESIVRLCHDEWGAQDVNNTMLSAAEQGHECIVRLCHDKYGATNVLLAMISAHNNHQEHIVHLCRQWRPDIEI